ncbi:MAG: LPS export ABC transporter periplasmic protein LptC [Saprospiraceae bacterium]|nr:LPS export ABC transporter periplasmic protein LptC [Saprospiraceae bacterium]
MKQVFFLLLLLAFAQSCVVDQADLSRYLTSGIENVEEAKNIEVIYTDSSYTVFVLKAPVSRRIYQRQSVIEEFPEGIEVAFYDKSRTPKSWLTSDFAVRDQANRKITVQKNVVLRNDSGERLDGPELIWDEKTKEIYTDRFVRITRADGSIVYSYGFKSNEGFTRYELNAVSGDMNVKEVTGESADSLHQEKPRLQPHPIPVKPSPMSIQDRKGKVKGEL